MIKFINRDRRFSIINNKDVRIYLFIDEVFFKIFIFNWRIIALECCVGFYHTTVRISQKCVCVYIYIPFLSSLPPTSAPIPPIKVIKEHRAELPVLYSSFPLAIYFTHGSVMHVNPTLSNRPSLSFPPLCPQIHSTSTPLLPPLQTGSSPFF